MRILFISDLHGIYNNLKILDEKQFDKLVILGDLFSNRVNYQDDYELKQILDKYREKIICLIGNCDSEVELKALSIPVCDMILISTDDLEIYCHHGHRYSYSKSQSFHKKGILVYGHEHHPYIKQEGDMTYICVGSISVPRYNSEPSFCFYENREFIIYNVYGENITSIKL